MWWLKCRMKEIPKQDPDLISRSKLLLELKKLLQEEQERYREKNGFVSPETSLYLQGIAICIRKIKGEL